MLVLSALVSSLFLAGLAAAEYRPGYGSDDDSDSTDSPSAVAVVAGASTAVVVAAEVTPAISFSTPSASASKASLSTGHVTVHLVKVSNQVGNLAFEPYEIKANAGSIIQFHFYPKNHSVVQSTFDQPCQPISNITPNVTGLFSGFMPVPVGTSEVPVYNIMLNDTKPIWFYCSQGRHCQDGMVGVINAPATNKSRTLASYQALAKQAPANLSPSEGGASTPSQSVSPSTVSLAAAVVPHSSSAVSPSVNRNSTASRSSTAAQVTTNAASGSVHVSMTQTVVSVGIAGLVAAVCAFSL